MEIRQKAILLLSLEKDDERNMTKMQLRIWCLNNRTTLIVRAFKHNNDISKVLWNGVRENAEINYLILDFLNKIGIVKESKNWDYSVHNAINFKEQDTFEEKENCIYFAFEVKANLLHF